MKKFLTIALPYINGLIHIGHIYEFYISNFYSIILKKFYKCEIFSGLDCHGLYKKKNILKIEYFNRKKYFFYKFKIKNKKTNSIINKRITNWVFIYFNDINKIFSKLTKKFFNKKKNFFIPDKYIKILCKNCNSEMENFFCYFCKKKSNYSLKSKILKKNIKIKKINSLFLKNYIYNDWDISRNEKYNGFKIISKKKIYFYVWFDAILSYISNNLIVIRKNILKNNIFQIIGKDILYFHIIFNIMLKFLNLKKTIIIQHGFIINKKKISKSEKKKIKKIKPIFLNFFFLINNKNIFQDINLNYNSIKKNLKKILLNKIINLFFRMKKIFEKFDNKINDFFFYKECNIEHYLFKKNKLNLFINKNIYDLFLINKKIENNKFWKKKNFFLIHYFYSKKINFLILKLNLIFKIINNTKTKFNVIKNYIMFNFKKFYEN